MTETWYCKFSRTDFDLQKEADWESFKNTAITAILGGLILIMGGSAIKSAADRMNLPEEALSRAMQDDDLMQKARVIFQQEEQPTQPQAPSAPQALTSTPSFEELKSTLEKHEGKEYVAYPDPIKGDKVPTIGIGHNLTKPGSRALVESLGLDYDKVVKKQQRLNEEQVDALFKSDIAVAVRDAKSFVNNFDTLPKEAKMVVIDMSFNMGLNKLSAFQNFKAALEKKDFSTAAKEMVSSDWYSQVGDRSKYLVSVMNSLSGK